MLTCNKCGRKHFLKFLETEIVSGVGVPYDRYEKMPDGWECSYINVGERVVLCPQCNGCI